MSRVRNALAAMALSVGVLMSSAIPATAISITATVPNRLERTCWYGTSHCTAYKQVNGKYQGVYPSVCVTKRWIGRDTSFSLPPHKHC